MRNRCEKRATSNAEFTGREFPNGKFAHWPHEPREGSPSPPLEERVGERRPFLSLRLGVHGEGRERERREKRFVTGRDEGPEAVSRHRSGSLHPAAPCPQ